MAHVRARTAGLASLPRPVGHPERSAFCAVKDLTITLPGNEREDSAGDDHQQRERMEGHECVVHEYSEAGGREEQREGAARDKEQAHSAAEPLSGERTPATAFHAARYAIFLQVTSRDYGRGTRPTMRSSGSRASSMRRLVSGNFAEPPTDFGDSTFRWRSGPRCTDPPTAVLSRRRRGTTWLEPR
jgi:hypothetical protein